MPRVGDHFSIASLVRHLNHIWGQNDVGKVAPTINQMSRGEIVVGDGTESDPDAGSNAIYFKPDSAKIVVIAVAAGGGSMATRHIT